MDKKIRKPLPTTVIATLVLIVASVGLVCFEEYISALLMGILILLLGGLQLVLWLTSHLLHTKEYHPALGRSYGGLAQFYLKDRRLPYNKGTFRKAITGGWLDVVNMCLILGIQDVFDEETKEDIVREVIAQDHKAMLIYLKNAHFFECDEELILYALELGSLACCEWLQGQIKSAMDTHEINFLPLDGPLTLEESPEASQPHEHLLDLVATGNQETQDLLAHYLQHKGSYNVQTVSGVGAYLRLSTIEATMQKAVYEDRRAENAKTKEECTKDLVAYIKKNYQFSSQGQYSIEGIYKRPQYLESEKVPCSQCQGEGTLVCSQCGGEKFLECPSCEGKGEVVCHKCGGKQVQMCWDVKKYLQCQTCHKGEFACHKCDDNGMAVCPECMGHGTRKCSCPKSKKIKCPHCNKGFMPLKNGMYKKCEHCQDGWICSLCHNSGWVIAHDGKKELMCPKCQGTKKIVCPTCRGKHKLKCSKAHEIPCDCHNGMESCEQCGGKKVIGCDKCQHTGKEPCKACDKGYIYQNMRVDFKGKQKVLKETILEGEEEKAQLQGMISQIGHYVESGNPYIEKVYTLGKERMASKDLRATGFELEKRLKNFVKEVESTGVYDVLEIIPLTYQVLSFQSIEEPSFECVMVNKHHYELRHL
ncbi:MAG: hypothetical protein ACRCTE_11425 [Cellulosilyticaceae bacterium]